MLLEPGIERVVDDALDHRAHLGGDELVLGLRGELRVRHLDRQHRGQALAAIVAGERDLLLARARRLLRIAGDLARQRAAEAREMRAAVALRDVVGEAEHVLVVAVVPPQRALDADAVALRLDHDRLRHQRRLVAVEIFHERLDAALVAHLLALLDRVALVGEHDGDAGIEERELAQAVLQRGEVELDHREGLRSTAGTSPRCRACSPASPTTASGATASPSRELHEMLFAVAPDRQLAASSTAR